MPIVNLGYEGGIKTYCYNKSAVRKYPIITLTKERANIIKNNVDVGHHLRKTYVHC